MNNPIDSRLTLNDLNIGDWVIHIRPDGSEGDEGIVVAKDTRSVSVRFEDELEAKNMQVFQLKKL